MGGAGFLVIIIAFGFLYFVLIRPQKKRQLASQRMLNELHVGDEVVTAGGIYGEIVGLGDEDVTVRIAPELDVRVARRAIASVITSAAPDPDELEAPEEPDATGPTPGT
jgi:preprotein translocase subunit YajC